MADNKSLMTEINKHTRNIDKKVSRFGTKLPGNANKEQVQKLEELSYEQMIMGTLASLVWGVNTKDKNKVKNLITGNKSTIYNLLKDISENLSAKVSSKNVNISSSLNDINISNESINKITDNIINGLQKNNVNDINISNESINKITDNIINGLKNNNVNDTLIVDFANVQSVKDLNDLIKNLSSDKISNNTYVGLSSIIDLFKTLASNDLKDLAKTSAPNLKELSTLLNTYSGELNKIFTALNEIIKGKDLQFNLTSLSNIIDTIIKILEIDSSKINISGLVMLTNITDTKHGYIAELLKNLQESSRDIELNHESFIVLETFFNSLISLVDIGFIKRRRIRNNVSFIKKYIVNDIPDIIAQLDKVVLNNKETAYAAINTLSSLFTAISEISNLNINDRIRLLLNLKFIKKVYINEIVEILNKFQNIVNGDFISVLHALDSITKVFDMILKIGDISTFKLFKISFKTDAMIDIIEDSIESLIDIIINIKNTKQASLKIEEINRIFSAVQSIYESTPGLMNSMHEAIKINLLQSNIELLNDLVDETNNVHKIKSHKLFETQLPKLIDDIVTIFKEISHKQLEEFTNELLYFDDNIIKNISKTIISINEIPALTNNKTWINTLKKILKEFDTSGTKTGKDTIGTLLTYIPNKENLEAFLQLGISLKTFVNTIVSFEKLDKKQQENIKSILSVTKSVVEQFNSEDKKSIAYHLSKIKDKDVEKIDTIITILKKLSKLNKIKIVLNISAKAIKEFAKIANPLKSFILKLASVKNRDIKKANRVIDSFIKIVVGGAAILLLGSLVIGLVKPANLVLFTVTLGMFLTSLGLVFWAVHRGFKNAMRGARDAMIIVGLGGAVMIFGSWFTSKRFFAGALLFTIELGLFLTAIGLVFWLVSRGFKRTMKGAREAMFVVGTAALVLILGSISHRLYNFADTMLFVGELSIFLLALGGVFFIIGKLFKYSYKNVKRALKIVAMSALVMIGAQLIYKYLDPEKIFGFLVILGGFLIGLGLVYKVAGKLMKRALITILLCVIVTTLSAAMLLFIGLITKHNTDLLLYALLFAAGFSLYVAIIGGVCYLLSKIAGSVVVGALVMTGIMLVTLIAVGVMWLMYAVCNQPGFFWTIIVGLISMGIVFTVFGGIMFLLGNFIVDSYGIGGALLAVGAIALTGIIAVVALASLTMALMYWACSDEDFFWTILKGLGAMTIVFVAFATMIGVLGTIMLTGVGALAFAAGVTALVIIEGVVGLAALVVKEIAKAVKELKSTAVNEADIQRMKNTVIGFAEILEVLLDKMPWNPLKLVKLVAITEIMQKASQAISSIARSIKEFSTMKFASEFDKNGKPKAWVSITNTDFDKATQNIGKTITAVLNSLVEVSKRHPELFDEGLFTDSPAMQAARVAKMMGGALKSIAEGLKDWSEMRIASKFDKNGNPIEWISLKDGDFKKVSQNIGIVLTALGKAIVETAKGNEDIFGSHWYDGILGNDSPAMNATKCIKMMGDVLTETATAVFAYSEGVLPVYGKDGHLLPRDQWLKLDKDDLEKGKGSRLHKTIKLILTALGDSIIDVVEGKDSSVRKLFDTSIWSKLFGGGEGMNIAKAISDMANGLSQTVDVIGKIQNMNFDVAPGKIEAVKKVLKSTISSIIGMFDIFNEDRSDIIKTRDVKITDNVVDGTVNNVKKVLGKGYNALIGNSWIGRKVKQYTGKDISYNYRKDIKQTKATVNQYVKDHKDLIKDTASTIGKFIGDVNELTEKIASFIKTYAENENYFTNYESIDIIGNIRHMLSALRSLQISSVSMFKNVDTNQFKVSQDKINTVVSLYTNTLEKISNLIKQSRNQDDYNVLKDGIIQLIAASQEISSDSTFENYVNDIERFVNTINSVQLDKINELMDLVTAMNNLSTNIGEIDKLSDSISNKLTVVLFELVSQLRKAESTIENAHTLQDKRKKLMEESIGKMKDILNQHMIVEIYQSSDSSATNPQTIRINENTVDYNNPVEEDTNTESSSTVSTPDLPNPENADANVENKSITDKPEEYEKTMTFFEFKTYMETEFINNFRNSGA